MLTQGRVFYADRGASSVGANEAASHLSRPTGFSQINADTAQSSKVVIEKNPLRASIIVPTYHRSKELSELLTGLLAQTVKPIEVIVVDDTPTHGIRLVCEDHEARFLKARVALIYVRNTRERSTAIARNIGAGIAKGDILIFVDSDIILCPNYIQEILKTFREYPESLGVTGWIQLPPHPKGISYYLRETLKRLFFLFHDSNDRCRFPEYPTVLTKIINCQWFSGSNMAWKQNVFNEHKFDEDLKGYAFMEDVLFSGLIAKDHADKLLMTPDARCIHTFKMEGRPEEVKLRQIKFRNRKYVLTRLFGAKGMLMFGWENFGLLILRLIMRIRKKKAQDTFL